jgi:hypothetical protein
MKGSFTINRDDPRLRKIDPISHKQEATLVLPIPEINKGIIRPVFNSYVHLACRRETIIGLLVAWTFARKPDFYTETYCAGCRGYHPCHEFVWLDHMKKSTEILVGS